MPCEPTPADGSDTTAGDRCFTLELSPQGPSVAAPAQQTLLSAALAAGIELRSSCRNGTCRACLRRLERGRVSYRIAWPGLSAEEKAEGFILPCVAHPESDLTLAPDDRPFAP